MHQPQERLLRTLQQSVQTGALSQVEFVLQAHPRKDKCCEMQVRMLRNHSNGIAGVPRWLCILHDVSRPLNGIPHPNDYLSGGCLRSHGSAGSDSYMDQRLYAGDQAAHSRSAEEYC